MPFAALQPYNPAGWQGEGNDCNGIISGSSPQTWQQGTGNLLQQKCQHWLDHVDDHIHRIQLDYTFMHIKHLREQETSYLHDTHGHRVNNRTRIGGCLLQRKGLSPHQASQLHRWIIKHGFTKSVLQSDHETSLMQLVSTIATDLKLPTRISPPCVVHLGMWTSGGRVSQNRTSLLDALFCLEPSGNTTPSIIQLQVMI